MSDVWKAILVFGVPAVVIGTIILFQTLYIGPDDVWKGIKWLYRKYCWLLGGLSGEGE